MREIKFRAWDKSKNEWYNEGCPELLTYYGFHLFGECALIEPPRIEDIQHLDIQQFTGLKDKNGKEIYEGDILQKNCLPKKGYVKFADGCFFIQYEHDSNFIASRNAFEIIGNIHESPELVTTNT